MKWILPALLLLFFSPMYAQSTVADAVRAYRAGNYDEAKVMFGEVLAADPKNQAAQNYLAMMQSRMDDASSLSASLKKIILPKVDFQDVSAREAVTFIAQQVDKESGGKQTLNVVWMVPDGEERQVTLSLQKIPASEALRYVADAAGLSIAYDKFAVKIKPAPNPSSAPENAPAVQ